MDHILSKEEEDTATVDADMADAEATTEDAASVAEDPHQERLTINNSQEHPHNLNLWYQILPPWDHHSRPRGRSPGIITQINHINRITKATPHIGAESPTLRGIVIIITGSRRQRALLSNGM